MITTTDKVHLKCDCVDGSIVNGIREQILFSFNLSAPPGYKIIKEPTTVLYKSINKTRLDTIQFFLEDSNHDSVLTFTIQIIKVCCWAIAFAIAFTKLHKNDNFFLINEL